MHYDDSQDVNQENKFNKNTCQQFVGKYRYGL